MDTETNAPTWKDLLTVLITSLLSSEQRGRFHLYLLQEAISGNSSLRRRFQETYCLWFSMVDEAYLRMGREGEELEVKAAILVAVLDGLIIQVLLDIKPPPIDILVKHAMRLIDP